MNMYKNKWRARITQVMIGACLLVNLLGFGTTLPVAAQADTETPVPPSSTPVDTETASPTTAVPASTETSPATVVPIDTETPVVPSETPVPTLETATETLSASATADVTSTLENTVTPTMTLTADGSISNLQGYPENNQSFPGQQGSRWYASTHSAILYSANWTKKDASCATDSMPCTVFSNNPTYAYSSTAGNDFNFTFYGDGVQFVYITGIGYGFFDVYIDGIKVTPVSISQAGAVNAEVSWPAAAAAPYPATPLPASSWTSPPTLTLGIHSLRFTHSSGNYVNIEAIGVTNLLNTMPNGINTYFAPIATAVSPFVFYGDGVYVNCIPLATMSIDGHDVGTCPASGIWQSSSLGSAIHTFYSSGAVAQIMVVGTMPPAGAGTYDDLNTVHIQYTGSWASSSADGLYNGSHRSTSVNDDTAAFSFIGGGVSLLYSCGPNRGQLNVTIDGVLDPTQIIQTCATTQRQQRWTSAASLGLSSPHTIVFTNASSVNGSSVNVDALIVSNLPPTAIPTYTPASPQTYNKLGVYDDTSSLIQYAGVWNSYSEDCGIYNNTEHYSGGQGSRAIFNFNGPYVSVLFSRDNNRSAPGNMDVYIDDVLYATINQYNPFYQPQQRWNSSSSSIALANDGQIPKRPDPNNPGSFLDDHKLEVRQVTTRRIYLDAIVVGGDAGTGTYDDSDPRIRYAGAWQLYYNTSLGLHSNGEHRSTEPGATAKLTFSTGTNVTLIFSRNGEYGRMSVGVVDGLGAAVPNCSPVVPINLNNPLFWPQDRWTCTLSSTGPYTLTVTSVDIPSAVLDAVIIGGSLSTPTPVPAPSGGIYDDTDYRIEYRSGWESFKSNDFRLYNGTEHYSQNIGATALFPWNGSRISIRFTRSPRRGLMSIYDCDYPAGTTCSILAILNQYGSDYQAQRIWNSASLGPAANHILKVKHDFGEVIDIDAIEVAGP